MALSDEHKISLSFKKLIAKEFTDDSRAFFEEVSTNTLEISSEEIYTQNIPGDSSTIDDTIGRKLEDFILTPDPSFAAGGGQGKVWFVCSGSGFTPDGSTGFDRALVQRNFISPKYQTDVLGNANNTGYAAVLKNQADEIISPTDPIDWYFDYKTGILSVQDPNNSRDNYYKITVYQYIGKTLDTSLLETVNQAGIFKETGSFHSAVENILITGSLIVSASHVEGGVTSSVDFTGVTGGVSGSFSGSFNGNHTGTGNFSTINASSNVDIDGTLDVDGDATFDNVRIDGDLTVVGTTTNLKVSNVEVSDAFMYLASSSAEDGTPNDGGIIVEQGSGTGTALFFDSVRQVWAIKPSGVNYNATSVSYDANGTDDVAHIVTVHVSGGVAPSDPAFNQLPIVGDSNGNDGGNIGHFYIDKGDQYGLYVYMPE